MTETGNGAASGTRAVDRAADLVSTVVRADEPMTFADLQESSGLAKSTASRMLSALERSGLCSSATAPGRTSPARCSGCTPPGTTRGTRWSGWPGRPWRRSATTTRETVHLSVTRGDKVVQVAQVDSRHFLGTRDWTEIDVPEHCSALGKVFYAWGALPIPDGPLQRLTDATITDPQRLRRTAPAPASAAGRSPRTSSRSG